MRYCKIEGCGRIHSAKGYCVKHYCNFKTCGHPLGKFKGGMSIGKTTRKFYYCKIKNCKNEHDANGYCHKHYVYYRRTNHGSKCLVKGCNVICPSKYSYCAGHRYRIKNNFPLDLSIKCWARGERNFKWKGGIAEYPNHYLMKKNRLIILIRNPKCEKCGADAIQIHHKDFSKDNHKLSNLMAVCHKCNMKLSNKYYQKYGFTMTEIVNMTGRGCFYWRHHNYELDRLFIKNT